MQHTAEEPGERATTAAVTTPHLRDVVSVGARGYLVTVTADGHPHVVSATPSVCEGTITVPGIGGRTADHLATGGPVTVLWPPAHHGEYTLIVDGGGEMNDDVAIVHPTRAVLHRPGGGSAGGAEGGCTSDCVELAYG